MTEISRREWIKVVGAAGAGSLLPADATTETVAPVMPDPAPPRATTPGPAPGEILPLTSTSDVFVPPRGRSFVKFSFDFPEPSVAFGDLRFGFLVFTDE